MANLNADPTVPCGLCGTPTTMLGTKRCDRCYELESRVQRDPELARKVLNRMMKDDALIVRYERRGPSGSVTDDTEVLDSIRHTDIPKLIRRIETGETNHIVLVGPNVACGWRVTVKRRVRFVERAVTDEQDAAAQRQAEMRIMERT